MVIHITWIFWLLLLVIFLCSFFVPVCELCCLALATRRIFFLFQVMVSSDYKFGVISRRFSTVNIRDTVIYGILKLIHVKEVILTVILTHDIVTKLNVLSAKYVSQRSASDFHFYSWYWDKTHCSQRQTFSLSLILPYPQKPTLVKISRQKLLFLQERVKSRTLAAPALSLHR